MGPRVLRPTPLTSSPPPTSLGWSLQGLLCSVFVAFSCVCRSRVLSVTFPLTPPHLPLSQAVLGSVSSAPCLCLLHLSPLRAFESLKVTLPEGLARNYPGGVVSQCGIKNTLSHMPPPHKAQLCKWDPTQLHIPLIPPSLNICTP